MSTEDQVLSAALHGEALLTAQRPELQPLIGHLREVAQGRDDIRIECAGVIAGSWFSSAARRGEDLIADGLLMLAGHVDLDKLRMGAGWLGASPRGIKPLPGQRGLGPHSPPRKVTGCLVCPVARYLRNLGSMKGVACLGQHHSADTLRSDHVFPGSPGLPNRGDQGGTSKVWPRANCAPAQRFWEVGSGRPSQVRLDAPPRAGRPAAPSKSIRRSRSRQPRGRAAGQLDWWVKERQEWWGRVRGADGRQRWIKAADLRPANKAP